MHSVDGRPASKKQRLPGASAAKAVKVVKVAEKVTERAAEKAAKASAKSAEQADKAAAKAGSKPVGSLGGLCAGWMGAGPCTVVVSQASHFCTCRRLMHGAICGPAIDPENELRGLFCRW